MKITKKQLSLEDGLQNEWVISNGIGGYASTTVIGANTRRYHGLLVAALNPPAKRYVVLSKLDENISFETGESYNLYTNVCENYISDGYKSLESFEKDYLPEYTFKCGKAKITKKIAMEYGRNTVVIKYVIKNDNKNAKMTFAPLLNFRDFHKLNGEHYYDIDLSLDGSKAKIYIDKVRDIPIYMYCSDSRVIAHDHDIFKNMYFIKEEERGFDNKEDLIVPLVYEVDIKSKETKEISFVCSLEDNTEITDVNKVISDEEERLKKVVKDSELQINKVRIKAEEKEYNEVIKDLVIAADSFVIDRPIFGLHSCLAGFPWFLDWGRDTLIAFEGLFLITKRFDLAKEILLTFSRDIKQGLVPNGYSGFDNRPLYNSADSSLLLFEAINKYLKYTKDFEFVEKYFYLKLRNIVDNYKQGIDLDDNNIYVDKKDNLLVSGTPNTQNTWMDAKIGDTAITPRNGKVVELNALWYNALKTLEYLAKKFDNKDMQDMYKKEANAHKRSFAKAFYNAKKKCLYDVIGDEKIRPNQLFAISLTYPVISPSSKVGKELFNTCTKKLLTKYGLRTLSPDDEHYIPNYEGGPLQRDSSYHQGPAWTWLLGLYEDAYSNIINEDKDRLEKEKEIIAHEKFIKDEYKVFKKELYNPEGVATISELYNSEPPYESGGTFSQAWSVSEVIKIITKLKI